MFDANSFIASFVWGTIATGIFVFGWKQKSVIPLVGGVAMGFVSYFVGSALYMSLASILIMVVMYCAKKLGYGN